MKTKEVTDLYGKYVVPTYTQSPLVLVRGKGLMVWDIEGKQYLDFFPGWAVSGLGHCHPMVVNAVKDQCKRMIHISNNYYNHLQAKLAGVISKSSFGGKVFFCNSGAEANEAAIKFARIYGGSGRFEIITMKNSFHGRTLATVAATGQDKIKKGFDPLPEGFKHAPFNDFEAVKNAVTDKTTAIMLEPIQGEGGINIASKDYMFSLKQLCNEKNLLLIFDEVQTGMGRTGEMFCYQHYGVIPDIMTLAKSLGGGVPIGAMAVRADIAHTLKAGSHASTFGGSPLVCRAALAVFKAIEKDRLLNNVNLISKYLFDRLDNLREKYGIIKEIRGLGLMIGVELREECKPLAEECVKRGLLINCTQGNVLRLMPPLIVSKKHVDKALSILDKALEFLPKTSYKQEQ
ncbi:MAG: aspartate aminotransferase family protein [Candidatus Omnitrophota bacterium]|nr:aspartate aminotransferase family protein [Candidatus Omnitrophota bacterium]